MSVCPSIYDLWFLCIFKFSFLLIWLKYQLRQFPPNIIKRISEIAHIEYPFYRYIFFLANSKNTFYINIIVTVMEGNIRIYRLPKGCGTDQWKYQFDGPYHDHPRAVCLSWYCSPWTQIRKWKTEMAYFVAILMFLAYQLKKTSFFCSSLRTAKRLPSYSSAISHPDQWSDLSKERNSKISPNARAVQYPV